MAIQLESPWARLGTSLGTGLGSGIGAGLQQIASSRIQQLVQREQQGRISQALQGLGVAPEMAQTISLLPEQLQGNILQNLPVLLQGQQAISQQQGLPALEQLATPKYEVPTVGGLEFPQPPAPVRVQAPAQMVTQPASKAEQLAQALVSPQERRELRKFEQKERQLSQQEKAQAFKLTKDERKQIINEGRLAKQQLEDLDRLEELQSTGKLDTPGFVEGIKRAGIEIPALLSPESEEYQKIIQNFAREAKNFYGGRVTNFEMEQFLKAIPSLSQSPEGQKRVIANLKRLNRLKVETTKALNDVIKENNGVPPLDLLEQIDERVDKVRDKLAEKFKKDLERPVPAAQNKVVTALQSILGTVAGRLPKAAFGAGAGAIAGSKFGPAGVIPGAAIGGLAGLSGISLKDLL